MNPADYEHGLAGLDADIAARKQRLAPVKPEQADAGGHVLQAAHEREVSEVFPAIDRESSASFSTTCKTALPKPTGLLLETSQTRKSDATLQHLIGEPNDPRPKIELVPGELDRIVDDMEQLLSTAGGYYNRGGLIASVVQDAITPPYIKPLRAPGLMRALSRAIDFERFDGRSKSLQPADPPPKYVAALFEAESYPHLSLLRGIARQPHFRADGSLCVTAGYDSASGLYGAFNPAEYCIKEAPTEQDAQHALAQIKALLTGFAFEDANAHAAALSGILTAAIRPTLTTAPMYHAAAYQPSSGKSYLTKIIAGFAGPGNPAMLSMPPKEAEVIKLLLATLLEAPCAVVFDNLTADIEPYGSLCTTLTEPTIQGRLLGFSKNATVSTRTMVLSSGNNVVPVRDMARRVITIRLDPKTENPELRQFTDSPLATLEMRRGEFVGYALTIIRAYRVAQCPRPSCTGFGGYDEWSAQVREPLLWLGVADPVANIAQQLTGDPDREDLGRLLSAWRKVFGARAVHIADAVKQFHPGGSSVYGNSAELLEVCMELAQERGQINTQRLGKWIARHEGQIVGGLRFEKSLSKSYSQKWQVVQVAAPEESPDSRTVGLSRLVLPVAEKLADDTNDGEEF